MEYVCRTTRAGLSCLLVLMVVGALPSNALATNGYFVVGYGPRSQGVGGASLAFPQDAMVIAANPAGIGAVDDGFDVSLQLFLPDRMGSLDTSKLFGPSDPVMEVSESPAFFVPNIAYVQKLDETWTLGLMVYASGGMNTDYADNVFHEAFGPPIGIFSAASAGKAGLDPNGPERAAVLDAFSNAPNTGGRLGVNLEQGVFAPSVAYKLTPRYTIGISVLAGFQNFSAVGLGDFVGFSTDPEHLTDNGKDWSLGLGVRAGLLARPTDWLSIGVSGASKIYMQPFEEYAGLFAEGGDFDIPANVGAGIALHPTDRLSFAVDVSRIFYEGVASVANRGPTADNFLTGFNTVLDNAFEGQTSGAAVPLNRGIGHALGGDDGYGFGWTDIWVAKVGVAWRAIDTVTLRAGYDWGQNPVADDQTLFNILAPGVTQHHVAGGASWAITDRDEISFAYVRVLRNDQSHEFRASPETTEALAGSPNLEIGYDTALGMDQHAFEIGYRRRM